MNEGYIKLHRAISNSPIYLQSPLHLRVFERLILEANHCCKRIPYNGVDKLIKRGERLTSIRQISSWVAWYERGILRVPNVKTISNILNWLIDNNMIKIYNKGNAQETHYNIIKYCDYQARDDLKVTVSGAVSIQRADTNKNVKNLKNVNKTIGKDIYAEFVLMTPEEHQKLIDEFGEAQLKEKIERLNLYKGSTGKIYKSDYMTILSWDRKEKKENEPKRQDSKFEGIGERLCNPFKQSGM